LGFPADFNGVPVVNLVEELPHSIPVVQFPKGGEIRGLFVHHEAGDSNVWGVANYHVKTLGWEHIGYTWFIEADGTIQQTLPLEAQAFHLSFSEKYGNDPSKAPEGNINYWNEHGWAMCLAGNLEQRPPTERQWQAAIKLAVAVRRGAPNLPIWGHREIPGQNTACPGKFCDMDRFRSDVEKSLAGGAISVGPGEGDDPWFKQFPSWRDAAINAKGVADDALNRMRKVAALLEVTVPRDQEALRIIREVVKD
jgi:hypothetical protein